MFMGRSSSSRAKRTFFSGTRRRASVAARRRVVARLPGHSPDRSSLEHAADLEHVAGSILRADDVVGERRDADLVELALDLVVLGLDLLAVEGRGDREARALAVDADVLAVRPGRVGALAGVALAAVREEARAHAGRALEVARALAVGADYALFRMKSVVLVDGQRPGDAHGAADERRRAVAHEAHGVEVHVSSDERPGRRRRGARRREG
mmetsp:Transcript_25973/g.88757  ORF Transcript_25973/g.88757 Transcript_25973/m.88757 type:complete len:210 (+) Transcript_25973:261-890(+)